MSMWVVCDVFDMILLALSTIDNSMRIVMRLGLGDGVGGICLLEI